MSEKTEQLESLAEVRMDTLYLERKAREAKDKKLAEGLAARGAELKSRIAELRSVSHEEWTASAKGLGPKMKAAQANLKDALKKAEKDQAWVRRSGKVLASLDNLLALAKKAAG
jgi:hypothetical protein